MWAGWPGMRGVIGQAVAWKKEDSVQSEGYSMVNGGNGGCDIRRSPDCYSACDYTAKFRGEQEKIIVLKNGKKFVPKQRLNER